MEINAIYSKLKENHLRLTQQRKDIANILHENKSKFISCEEIYELIPKDTLKTNISTIYRTLECFESIGIVHKKIVDGRFFYKLMCLDHHHHHLTCKICKKTIPFEYCPIKNLASIAKMYNFTIENHQIEIYGVCSECSHFTLPTK